MNHLPITNPKPFPLTSLSFCLGLLISLLGAAVILGWYWRCSYLIQIHPALVPMQFNTALGFLLSGTSLLASIRKRSGLASVLGILVALMGGLTLMEYGLGIDLGIDQLFMEHYITTQTSHPGRMAPNTALCFFLSGLVAVMANRGSRSLAFSVLGAVISGLGLIALFGYLTDLETAYGWGHLTRMAVHTSLGFVVLGIGISLWGISEAQKTENTGEHWAFIGISITLIVVVLAEWQAVNRWEEKRIKEHVFLRLDHFKERFEIHLENQKRLFVRMADRWNYEGGTPRNKWEADADAYLRHIKSLDTIVRVDPSFSDRWIVSKSENREPENPLFVEGEVLQNIRQDWQINRESQDGVVVSNTIPLTSGGYGYLIVVPLFADQQHDGFIVAAFDIETTLSAISEASQIENFFQLKVSDKDRLIVGSPRSFSGWEARYQAKGELKLGNKPLVLDMTLTKSYLDGQQSSLPGVILLSGLGLIAVMLYLYSLQKRDRFRANQMQAEVERRILAERSLEDSHNHLQLILDSTLEGIFGIDEQEKITFANAATCVFAGYPLQELQGRFHHDLIDLRLQNDATTSSEFSGKISTKLVRRSGEAIFYSKDGTSLPVDFTVNQLLDNDGLSTGAVVTFQDITNRKNQEIAIQKHIRELERSNTELDAFAYVASHDLKAPLRGIMQLANWIEEDLQSDISGSTKEYFSLLKNRVSRLERLLEDLLLYSRVGHKQVDIKEVNVPKMARDLFKLLNPPPGMKLICEKNLPTFITLATPFKQLLHQFN